MLVCTFRFSAPTGIVQWRREAGFDQLFQILQTPTSTSADVCAFYFILFIFTHLPAALLFRTACVVQLCLWALSAPHRLGH